MSSIENEFDLPDESEPEYDEKSLSDGSDEARPAQYVGESDLEEENFGEDDDDDENVDMSGDEFDNNEEEEDDEDSDSDGDKEEEEEESDEEVEKSSSKKKKERRGRTTPRFAQTSVEIEKANKKDALKQQQQQQKKAKVKRANKHAPQEISSKKPVSWNRKIIEEPKIKSRDPRFSSLSGNINEGLFKKSYGFLNEQKQQEIDTLRKTLKQKNISRVDRENIEATLKRMESVEEARKRKERENEVLNSWKKDEKSKRASGKKAWHLKKSAQKELLLKDRFEQLAKDKRKLHRVIDRKRKKQARKDKASMPAPRRTGED